MLRTTVVLTGCAVLALIPRPAELRDPDPRDLRQGDPIPDEGYCDQPYVVVTKEGHWLATLTTGAGREGQAGQHVVSTTSSDHGRSWSPLVDIEPADGPEASWVVPLLTPSGRVYVFYTYNGDRVHELPSGKRMRADTHGWYAMRYSDDGGRSWSPRRYRIPVRVTACDRTNDFGGKVQMFWGIDKPKVAGDRVYFAFTKLARYFLQGGEGWLFTSDDILTASDPESIRWELRPEGERGIRGPSFGSIQEEHNLVPLEGESLYCVYRTTEGYPCHAYSSDGGRTWTDPRPMTYTPRGRVVKQPRACPKLWRVQSGKFLFWYHLHGGRSFEGRNPAWISGGVLSNGTIHWSEPEVLLYDAEPATRMSYPDLIEEDGRYWVTETQKSIARVHEVDATLLQGLWTQGRVKAVSRRGLRGEARAGAVLDVALNLARDSGLTIDCWIRLENLEEGRELASSWTEKGRGISLRTAADGAVELCLSDGSATARWTSDAGLIAARREHHVVAIADAGPRIITFVVDGRLCDGGAERQLGWGRWTGALGDVSGSGRLRLAPEVLRARVYNRYLRTSEAIGNFTAGR